MNVKAIFSKALAALLAITAALFMFAPSNALAADAPTLLAAAVTPDGQVELTFSSEMAAPASGDAGFLVVGTAGLNKHVQSAVLDSSNHAKIKLTLQTALTGGENDCWMKYTPGTVQSSDGEALAEIAYYHIDNPLPHPTIDATPLPDGTVGTPYSFAFSVTGGTPPYTYYLWYGDLPPGLSLSYGGLISGTPSSSGTYGVSPVLRICVRDANSALDIRNITIVINAEPGSGGSPTVTTGAATDVTASGATLHGSVTGDGGELVTERGFAYGTSANPTIGGVGTTQVAAGSGTGDFQATLTGLAPGAYFARAYAVNSVGTSYGSEVTFTMEGGQDNIPDTGDSGGFPVWIGLAGLAMIAAGGLLAALRHKKSKA